MSAISSIKVKVVRRPTLKLKVLPRFPANVVAANFVTLTRNGGTYTLGVDYTVLPAGPIADPTTAYIAIQDQSAGIYRTVTLASLLTSGLDQDLQVIAALTGSGILARTGTNTWALRAITGTANEITVTNGDGVAGAPTVSLPAALTFTGKTVTGGTFNAPSVIGGTASALTGLGVRSTGAAFDLTFANTEVLTAGRTLTVTLNDASRALNMGGNITTAGALTTSGAFASIFTMTGATTVTFPTSGTLLSSTTSAGGDLSGTYPSPTIAANAVTNAKTATMAAYTIKANATAGAAVPTDVSIPALTQKASPVAADMIMIADSAASNALKYATVSSIASAGSVASVNGQTGSLAITVHPQGRLTLQTATPVMNTTQSAKTTLYYTSYVGNQVPIYDGTNMVPTAITGGEISVATTDTTKSPAAIGVSKVNDWFVWNDAGTIRLSHGPDWTSDTARSAGTALVMVNGILLNSVSITNGPAASRGTYVGTTRSNASSQLDWIYGASGTAAWFGVWNMYNRIDVMSLGYEGTASWSYNSTTTRGTNNSAKARASFVRGLDEDGVAAFAQTYIDTNSGTTANFGMGLDSSTANVTMMQATTISAAGIGSVQYAGLPGLGFHYLQQTEASAVAATAYSAYGNTSLSGFSFKSRM